MLALTFIDRLIAGLQASPLARISLFLVAWVVLWLPLAIPLAHHLEWHPRQVATPTQKLPLVLSLYLVAPIAIGGLHAITAGSFAEDGWVMEWALGGSLLWGLGLGSGGLMALFALEHRWHWIQWQSPEVGWRSVSLTLLTTLAIALGIGAIEELIFRGFLLSQLQPVLAVAPDPRESGWVGAAIITSLLFALSHLVWDAKQQRWQLPGLWLMGLVLCFARSLDADRLGLAWGLHAGWIWVMASLDSLQLVADSRDGPPWLVGVDHQPLAGMLGISFLLLTAGILWSLERLPLG